MVLRRVLLRLRGNSVGDTSKPFSLAELFCGCGGFSHGFALTGRFSVELGSDINGTFCETFQKNHFAETGKNPPVLAGDMEGPAGRELPLAFRWLGYHENGCLDVVFGPPLGRGSAGVSKTQGSR